MTTHIKEILENFLKETGEKNKEKERIQTLIREILGENVGKMVSIREVYKNKIVIYSDSSGSGYEVSLKKGDLLKKVKKEFPAIEEIKIKIG